MRAGWEIAHLPWGWTDYSRENAPSYTFTFTVDRSLDLVIWRAGEWAFYGHGRYSSIHDGKTLGFKNRPGVETDWNTQLGIGGGLNAARKLLSALLSGLFRGAASEATTFAAGQLEAHFQKHAAEFGYESAAEYLRGAQALIRGGPGVGTFSRGTDTLFYRAATNEFGVLTNNGVIRTYFRPKQGMEYWLRQTGAR